MTDIRTDYPHLRWKCRRGMLELDLFLEDILEHQFLLLSDDDKALFEVFLEAPDPVMMDWFMRRDVPNDPALRKLLAGFLK